MNQLPERFKLRPQSEELTRYIAKRYSAYGYRRDTSISYNSEFTPKGTREHYRWIENVSDGLREVGPAHEIIRLQHTGWYVDNFHDETVHGMVYQLPTRKGECQYVPAVDDPCNKNCACLDFHSIADCKEDAARWADSMAEQWAESEREYQAKESKRERLEEIEGEIKEEFADFRRIAKEIRASCDRLQGIAVVRELVRKQWQATKEAIHQLRRERERIEREGYQY